MAQPGDFDVIIAGGGMIGSTMALALAPLGLRIAVVEPVARGVAAQPSFDERSTALSRSSQRLFAALGLWPQIESAAAPIRHIHVSDQGRFGFSHIDAAEQGVEALGHVVINRVLGAVLQSSLAAAGEVTELCPARIVSAALDADSATVDIETGAGARRKVSAPLLIVADGAASTVRAQVGIGADVSSYRQSAIVGNLATERAIGDTAFERFTQAGPLAFLPLPGERAAFVWTAASRDAERIAVLHDDAFLAELAAAFGTRLGALQRVSKRSVYPLSLSKALRLTAERSVLIGNAAHGLHPVAAQGFNLGLRDVATLADCIADRFAATGDARELGNADVLARYAAWREADQRKLVSFTDGLVRLFTTERRPLRTLRNLGMLAFDLVPGVRREFARQTMGLAGRLPRLSRGVPLR